MKKALIIAVLAGSLLTACSGNDNKGTNMSNDRGTEQKPSDDYTANNKDSIQTELDRKTKEAKTIDSLRQVKEHGHAH